MKTRREIKVDLLNLYRHFFDGNTHTKDGKDLRAEIKRHENMLAMDDRNR